MAQDKDLKTPNVPPLRFPGFSDEWMESTIGEVAPLQRGFDLPNQQLEEGEYPVVYSNGIMNHHASYKCKAPGIITGRSGTVGKFTYIDDGYYWPHNTSLWVTGFFDNNPKFIYYLFQTIRIEQYSTGSGVPTLNRNDVHRHKVRIPKSIDEQNKIARLLSILDERIATQNKIIEDLKKLKSAIMAIIFGKTNVTNNQWREVRLGNICERVTRRNSNNISNLILTIAAQYGLVSQIDFFNKSVASADLSNYYLLDKGDFAYNKSYSGEYTWGAVKRLDLYPQGVLSPLYICFRPIEGIVDSDFLVYLFESKCWYREVSEICVEGARNHGLLNVSVVDFFNMKLHLPDLSEQKRIAEMMSAISDKIEHSSRLYALYNAQKTYLLSNMFI